MQQLLVIISFFITCSLFSQSKVRLSVNPVTAEVGETFEITISSTEVGTIDFGEMPEEFLQDYAVQQRSSQHTDPSGKTAIEHYYTISGIIKKPGNYTFGPVTLTHGNKTYVSNTAVISISPKVRMLGGPVTSRQLRDPAFGTIEVNKSRLYEGEPLMVRAKIYARYKPTHINNYQAYEMDGVLIKHPIGQNNQLKPIIEQFHGENVFALDFDKNIVFPTAVGKVKINSYKLNLQQDYQSFPVESSSLSVNILPLPSNPPNDFIGGVGDFAIQREIPEKSFNQGDVVKMMVTISGIGNIHNTSPPNLNLPKGFKVYGDPVSTEEFSFGVNGSQGKITYEYNIEVTASGTTLLPATSITYFDPRQEKYITISSAQDSLDIEPGDGFLVETPLETNEQRTKELIVQKFTPRDNAGEAEPGDLYGTNIFWGGISFPFAAAFLFLLFVKSRRQKEEYQAENHRKNMRSAAIAAQIQATKDAKHTGDSNAFYSALEKTLRSIYAIQMQKEDTVCSKEEIIAYAETISKALKTDTEKLFSHAEVARFSFGSDTDQRQEDLQILESIIQTLKATK